MISNEAVEAAVREVDRFVYKPPADELPSIEGHKNALMRAVLEAAAPYMLFAPEGVSEAKRDVADLIGRIIAARDDFKNRDMFGARYLADVLADAANALSSERERAEELKRERDKLEQLVLHDKFDRLAARADRAEFLLALALECARTKAAREAAMFDLADAAELRAQAAEAKVKELEAPFDWTAEDLVDLMAEAIMDAIDMDTNATDYARAALIALNKEGLLRPNDYREPQQ